jgi:LCP family protein required for cell wall assembly
LFSQSTGSIGIIPKPFMPESDEQRPSGPPDYKVYKARRGFLSRFRKPDLKSLRERTGRGPRSPDRGDKTAGRITAKRVLKWVGIAALGWIFVSFLAFAISAQIQAFKLSGEAKSALHGNPFLLVKPQTILVLGTDARPPETEQSGSPSKECFEQQAHGDTPHGSCSVGQFRADTLMLIRAGAGKFNKLSIPRDTYAEIPGQNPQKINAAYAFGGAKAEIEAVENFLNIQIDHVAIIDFSGFENLIDAVGGVEVNVPHKICANISGGAGGGQGGYTLRLGKGEHTLDGEQALTYSRIREPSPCPGPGASAYSLGYSDFDRERAQQEVISGIKGRLTDPLRIPYNFIKGPIIGWEAPKAFVSDMGFFTMPQLVLAAGIGGSSEADVLCEGQHSGCEIRPDGSIEVPESERRRAVKKLMG